MSKKTDFTFEGQMKLLWRATVISFAVGGLLCLLFFIGFQSLPDEEKKKFFETIEKIEIQDQQNDGDHGTEESTPPIDD